VPYLIKKKKREHPKENNVEEMMFINLNNCDKQQLTHCVGPSTGAFSGSSCT